MIFVKNVANSSIIIRISVYSREGGEEAEHRTGEAGGPDELY